MTHPSHLLVGHREIGPGRPCYVIAEAGVNHNGDRRMAEQLVDAAVDAGADAVKFQTFSAERLASPAAGKAEYQTASVPNGTQFDMLRRLELSEDDHRHLIRYAREKQIEFLSTPFDRPSAALLDRLGIAAFKIGSGDLTDRFLLSHVARTGRPLVLSTGGATLAEVRAALDVVEANGNPPVALLHCVSTYPAAAEDVNLTAMDALRSEFQRPVGFSDHTPDRLAPLLAVAVGACIVEKHLTLSRALEGPDHAFSLEPRDFALMVSEIRRAERAMGSGRKEPQPGEGAIMSVARKSLFSARRIEPGDVIAEEDVVALRPAGGISPMQASAIIGRVAILPIDQGVMFRLDMVQETLREASPT